MGCGKIAPAIVDVGTLREWEQIEIVNGRPQTVGDNLLVPAIGDALDAAPVFASAQLTHQLDKGSFTLKADDRIGAGDAPQDLGVVKARIMPADGDMGPAPADAQGLDHPRESRRHVLEYQGKPDHIGAQAGDQFHDRLGIGRIALDPA